MLRLMLTAHPKMVVPPECGFLVWLQPQFGQWGHSEFADADNRARFAKAVNASRKFDTWGLSSEEVAAAMAESDPRTYADACMGVYRLFAAREGKMGAILGDKNNYYLSHVAALKAMYPDARFLHIVRDGRDVACSYREVMTIPSASPYRPELPWAIADIARAWASDVQAIRAQFASLGDSDTLEIRYEDLASLPERELGRICAWLGIGFDRQMLQFHEENRARNLEPLATMDWKRRTTEPASDATIGRYKMMLSAREITAFEAIAAPELRQYGYLNWSSAA